MNESYADVKCFESLSEAVAFISELVETNSVSELMAQFAHIQRPNPKEPYYSDHFTRRIFPQLGKLHQEMDFRIRYEDKSFPMNETRFKLGGHFKELGCIHIDFEKTEHGWVLDDIWECR